MQQNYLIDLSSGLFVMILILGLIQGFGVINTLARAVPERNNDAGIVIVPVHSLTGDASASPPEREYQDLIAEHVQGTGKLVPFVVNR